MEGRVSTDHSTEVDREHVNNPQGRLTCYATRSKTQHEYNKLFAAEVLLYHFNSEKRTLDVDLRGNLLAKV